MIKIKQKMRQILTVPLVSLYPQTCGICGKISNEVLCNKCEIELRKIADFKIITKDIDEEKELKDKSFSELMYIFKYEGLIRKMILDYKFNDKSYLYRTFVKFMLKNKNIFEKIKNYDTIVPVPISKKRKKERGYNQSLLIAKEICSLTSKNLLDNCLVKTKNIIEQSKLNKQDRLKNIKGVYELKNARLIEHKKILLIDDIYTTGSTVEECSKTLIKGKPQKIGVITLAKD